MNVTQRSDLHCHSTFSDGSLTPVELVDLAIQEGLSGLSITDHDAIDSFEQVRDCSNHRLHIIPGVEFSCDYAGHDVHVLAYSYVPSHPSLIQLCQRHRTRREKRNERVLELLQSRGMSISKKDVVQSVREGGGATPVEQKTFATCGRPHIAQAMVRKGYVKDISTAFQLYLGNGKSCYDKGDRISVSETLDVIHEAQGIASLAHPHLSASTALVRELLKLPFNALEAYYCMFPLEVQERWVKMAQSKNLLITGGSDFHGSFKPHIRLGCSSAPTDSFNALFAHYKAHC